MTDLKLPEFIQIAIDRVLKLRPEFMTQEGACGNCQLASEMLLYHLPLVWIDEAYLDYYFIDNTNLRGHVWCVIQGWNVDLTARQFDPLEPCPKIWRNPSCSVVVHESFSG